MNARRVVGTRLLEGKQEASVADGIESSLLPNVSVHLERAGDQLLQERGIAF